MFRRKKEEERKLSRFVVTIQPANYKEVRLILTDAKYYIRYMYEVDPSGRNRGRIIRKFESVDAAEAFANRIIAMRLKWDGYVAANSRRYTRDV